MLSINERYDSWKNLLSGLGSRRDKSTYTHFSPDSYLPYDYLEHLYINDDVSARICEIIPNEMLRQGINIKVNGEDFLYPNLQEYLSDALIKSRIFGAAFIYVGVDDGYLQEEEMLVSNIKKIKFLNILTAKELRFKKFYSEPTSSKFGEAEVYGLNQSLIHESRLIAFYGARTLNHKNFPPSILQRIYPVLQQFHTAWQSTAHLMTDAAQGIFKLKGLHSAVASNRSDELLKRMEMVDMSRSVSRSILLDAEDEDFRRDSYSFGGIPEILDKMMLRLAAAARLPVSLLMGQAPAGMNATGESDTRVFYDQVRAEQEAIKPKIEQLIKILTANEEAEISIEFPALWQMTDKEKAELSRIEAETDRIYLDAGVLLPEEVALKRFPENEFSADRAELVEAETDE